MNSPQGSGYGMGFRKVLKSFPPNDNSFGTRDANGNDNTLMHEGRTRHTSMPVGFPLGRGRGIRGYRSSAVPIVNPDTMKVTDATFTHTSLDVHQVSDYVDQDQCEFCNRKPGIVMCLSCGHSFEGRARKKCPSHPGVIHLMDIDACPKCKAQHLKECSNV